MPPGIRQYADFSVFNLRKMLRNASHADRPFFYLNGEKVAHSKVPPSYRIELVARIRDEGVARYQRHTLLATRKGIWAIRSEPLAADEAEALPVPETAPAAFVSGAAR